MEAESVNVAIATEGGNAQMVEPNTIEVTIPAYGYVIANK
jgi:hypothetical protein